MRAAIYARVSTDKQSADSTADQVARCREFAERRGFDVVPDLVVEESGISGESRHNRPGLLGLVKRIDEWDVLLCFDFTRLARDGEDLGWIRNRLRLNKRTAFEASGGLDLFNVGAKVMGILGEEYLVKLRADTHRGLRGRVERGLSGGGLPYGYRSEPVHGGRVGPRREPIAEGYRWVVDNEQAAVVRRILDLYVGGEGLRSIVHLPQPRARAGAPAARVAWRIVEPDRDPRDAAQPDLSRRVRLEPQRMGKGSRDGEAQALRAARRRVDSSPRRELAHHLG